MIIPVRCVTCGKVLADKWRYYQAKVAADADSGSDPKSAPEGDDTTGLVDQKAGAILDDMGITKMCCRRHLLANVDAMHRI